jgi:acyl-CoA synthetase (AMP-forming)/AMP-acid ligase II
VAAQARRHLAGYKLPRQLVLVDHVERSPSGKPDYRWAKRVAQAASS